MTDDNPDICEYVDVLVAANADLALFEKPPCLAGSLVPGVTIPNLDGQRIHRLPPWVYTGRQ